MWEHTWTATWTHVPLQCLHLAAYVAEVVVVGCRGVLFDIPLQHQVWDSAFKLAQPLSGLKLQADPQLPWEVLERRIHQLCDPWKQNTSCFSSWSCVALHV